jgi:hypothetical protein
MTPVPRPFPVKLLDRNLFKTLGDYRRLLFDRPKEIALDFSRVEWADPLSLLMLGVLLASYRPKDTVIHIKLGDRAKSTDEHRVFLKFFADQGFLESFAPFSIFEWIADRQHLSDSKLIKDHLINFPKPTNLLEADCIHSKLVPIHPFMASTAAFERFIDDLIREARVRLRDTAFGADPHINDRLFQKLRKLLFELALNIVEHAYPSDITGYAGVYVRVRRRRPVVHQAARKWDTLRAAERTRDLAVHQLELNDNADWLELFVCDAGRGLVHDLHSWLNAEDLSSDAKLAIREATQSTRKLFSIGPSLFKLPLSKYARRTESRPSVTGLQFLGHMLGLDGDFSRLYTEGQWLGGTHPWQPTTSGSRDVTMSANAAFAPGSAFSIVIQPAEQATSYPEDTWSQASAEDLSHIADTLMSDQYVSHRPIIIDRREVEDQHPPVLTAFPELAEEGNTIIFRPRRNLSKNVAAQWIAAFAGDLSSRPQWNATTLIFAELTPSQAIILAEAIKRFQVSELSQKDVYLVSEEWAVTCLSSSGGEFHLTPDHHKSRAFLRAPLRRGIPSGSLLALELRRLDSHILWSSVGLAKPDNSYVHGQITWTETVHLGGYLDLSVALTDPLKYRACRRALRRVVQLFPSLKPDPTDDVVASLLSDSAKGLYRTKELGVPPGRLAVGSVCVTSRTLQAHLRRYGPGAHAAIVLLVHGDGPAPDLPLRPIFALRWQPPPATPGMALPQFARIPDTPFIAPDGPKSISIVRFRPPLPSRPPFHAPYYARTPEQTYSDFLRYRALKIGHWDYRGRHDLLTINFAQIIEYSVLEHGPLLGWLAVEFERLFTSQDRDLDLPAALLVYPSHKITDELFQYIRASDVFAPILRNVNIVPIKFIGSHSVSPLLASPFAYEKIKEAFTVARERPAAAVIFDDAAVTGKHLIELTQILSEAGSGVVHTIALLDRTGLPVRDGVMNSFLRRHRRYWRWDVPTTGHGRDCILCAAIREISSMMDQSLFPPYRRRLAEWAEEWRASDVSENWHTRGLPPATFDTHVPITFGLQKVRGQEFRNTVFHPSSTGLASMLVELARLTTKADTALRKAEEVLSLMNTAEDKVSYLQAAIEILSAQLILFFDELSYWQKLERYWLLLQTLWTWFPEGRATSLVGLCFALITHEMARELWRRCQSGIFHNEVFRNTDAVLVCRIVYARAQPTPKIDYAASQHLTETARQNYTLLSNAETYRATIVRIFSVIGFRTSQSHESVLLRRLDKLNETTAASERALVLGEVQQFLKSLAGGFERLSELWLTGAETARAPNVIEDVEHLNTFIVTLPITNNTAGSATEKWATSVREWIFGTGLFAGVSRRYQQFFFQTVTRGSLQAAFLTELISSVRRNWDKIHEEKQVEYPSIAWRDKHGNLILPDIHCATNDRWDREINVCFDALVRECIRDILANVFHATSKMANPWNADDPSTAHLWWRALSDGGYLVLQFVNASRDTLVVLKPSAPLAGLQRIGGALNVDASNQRILVEVKLPLSDTLVGET